MSKTKLLTQTTLEEMINHTDPIIRRRAVGIMRRLTNLAESVPSKSDIAIGLEKRCPACRFLIKNCICRIHKELDELVKT